MSEKITITFPDGNKKEVETIELKLTVEDSGEIIPIQNQTNVDKEQYPSIESNLAPKSSFLLEKLMTACSSFQ